jgi:hypothetical protein
MRTINSPVTDPVSFAIAGGTDSASFAEAPGFAARDWARRAVAEHTAWLAEGYELDGRALGVLIGAARAALFLDTLDEGDPQLPLTASATLDLLGERADGAQEISDRAWEAYVADVDYAPRARPELVAEFARVVEALPTYAGARA